MTVSEQCHHEHALIVHSFVSISITTFYVPRFFSHSFTASDGSEESTAGRVTSPCSIMVHHGHRSKDARRAIKQKYPLRQATSQSTLLVSRLGDVSRKLNQVLLSVDSFYFNFVDEERSDICMLQNNILNQHTMCQ